MTCKSSSQGWIGGLHVNPVSLGFLNVIQSTIFEYTTPVSMTLTIEDGLLYSPWSYRNEESADVYQNG
jgi:hypothetical protein